jgi:hypothetical protein
MDSATKEVLLNLLKKLVISTENVHQCVQMSYKTYSALVRMFPFPELYAQPEGTFEDVYTQNPCSGHFERNGDFSAVDEQDSSQKLGVTVSTHQAF